MTKTRSLKSKNSPEANEAEDVRKEAPSATNTPHAAKEPQVDKVPAVAIAPELREALVNFLKTQPYAAVANLIQPLVQAQTVTLSIINSPR